MQLTNRIKEFFGKPFFCNERTLFWLWMMLAVVSWLTKHVSNNYRIFEGVFWHTWRGTTLYGYYHGEYADVNHYGPLFSIIVAPFALLPVQWGMLCWHIALTLALWWSLKKLELSHYAFIALLWFVSNDLLSALFMSQFNIATAAMIIVTFYCIQKGKDGWAALWIVIGVFVKLYGIVGLAFFFFSKNKGKFILSLIGWSVVAFVLPMLISSPQFIIAQYGEWADSLIEKNGSNMFSMYQNISFLGMVRKISGIATYPDWWIILPCLVLFALPYLRIKQYKHEGFRYALLASVLMFTVLFSSGSEVSTYIVASLGIGLWYFTAPLERSKTALYLLIFAIVLGSFGTSDLVPHSWIVHFIRPYALKVLPCTLIWFYLVGEMLFRDYAPRNKVITH